MKAIINCFRVGIYTYMCVTVFVCTTSKKLVQSCQAIYRNENDNKTEINKK